MNPRCSASSGGCCAVQPDGSLQDDKKLVDAGFFLFRHLALAAKQSGIEFGGEQRILKALHRPVEDGNHHFDIEVLAQFAALQAEAHESDGAIGIFGR